VERSRSLGLRSIPLPSSPSGRTNPEPVKGRGRRGKFQNGRREAEGRKGTWQARKKGKQIGNEREEKEEEEK